MGQLTSHSWKGKVRELETAIVQALVGCRGNVLLREDMDKILTKGPAPPSQGLDSFSLAHVEKKHISITLSQLNWNKSRAAKILGITLPTLRSKIKKYDIHPS